MRSTEVTQTLHKPYTRKRDISSKGPNQTLRGISDSELNSSKNGTVKQERSQPSFKARGRDNLNGSGGPPNTPRTGELQSPPDSSAHSQANKNELAAIGAFIISTGLAILTHFKENLFGSLTKAFKILFTFAAMFTGTVATAIALTKPSDDSSFQTFDFNHALH